MELEYRCHYCNKVLEPRGWAVFDENSGRTFCADLDKPSTSPDSCFSEFQIEYIKKYPVMQNELSERNYSLVKLSDFSD